MTGDRKNSVQYCWKLTGVFGDGSCPKLTDLVHCRNCHEYNKAGRSLLDREVPPEFLEESTRSLAGAKETAVPDAVSLTVFRVRNEWLALKTVCLQETTCAREPHRVPFRTNNVFKGIVNVNGELLLCISLANLIEASEEPEERHTLANAYSKRMLVIDNSGERYVFPVDEILGVRRVSLCSLEDPAVTISKSPANIVQSIVSLNETKIGVVDEDKLIRAVKRSIGN